MNKACTQQTRKTSFFETPLFISVIKIIVSSSLLIIMLINIFWRFIYPENGYLACFTDDFFYYLKVAENINLTNISSFDGIHLTNGYHPLWLIFMVGILKLTGTSNILFFLLLSLLILIVNILVYVYSLLICLNFFRNKITCYFIAFITTLFSLQVTRTGMEVALTIPVIFIIIKYILDNEDVFSNHKKIFFLAFLSSILVLSRLDSFLFVLILLARLFDFKSYKTTIKNYLFFGLGGILVPIYLVLNLTFFDTLMPVSGQIKHLKNDLLPSLNAIISLIKFRPQRIFIIPSLLASIFCIWIFFKENLFRKYKYFPVLCAFVFVFFHIMILSVLSDWPLWSWYSYSFVPFFCSISIVLIAYFQKTIFNFSEGKQNIIFSFLIILFLGYGFLSSSRYIKSLTPAKNSLYVAAQKIAKFEKTHKGIYAMGDRAGTPGYLIDSPLIQLEGLMMDINYLNNIKLSRDLLDVLREYKVDYYIATSPKKNQDTYQFVEPALSGDASPKMRAQLSIEPIYEFISDDNVHTAIFELKNINI